LFIIETFQDPKKLQEFKDGYAKLCEIEHNHNTRMRVARNFKANKFETFDKEYEATNKAAAEKFDPSACPKIKTFNNEIDALFNSTKGSSEMPESRNTVVDEDGDFEMAADELKLIDPMSKKQIRNPVRNSVCGHLYDKASIEDGIKTNSRIKCPYIGCHNKNAVKLSDLKEDRELKRKLEIKFMQMEED
jgi:E3 SUMO-protein ligase NSE2